MNEWTNAFLRLWFWRCLCCHRVVNVEMGCSRQLCRDQRRRSQVLSFQRHHGLCWVMLLRGCSLLTIELRVRVGRGELMHANRWETQDFAPTLSSHQPGQIFLGNALPSATFQPNPPLPLSFHWWQTCISTLRISLTFLVPPPGNRRKCNATLRPTSKWCWNNTQVYIGAKSQRDMTSLHLTCVNPDLQFVCNK